MILIIDDDESIRMSLALLLRRSRHTTDTAASPTEALEKVRAVNYALILMDMNYTAGTSGREGLELLRKVKIFQPDTPVILMTAWATIELAVEGIKQGAYDFITKPWHNLNLLQRIETALALNKNSASQPDNSTAFDRAGIIGSNPKLLQLLDTVAKVASTDAPVLILGENGTGKELVANAIHLNSRRRENPFVMVNLGGISQSLFESEMFGHTKGAFTGAVTARKGRFEMAHKGTIFLDEIGDLDPSCQVKMLRVLQQHTFEMLGDSRPRKVDIRVVCATNADLQAMVAEKTFREDLFYRINLITLALPPLRERRDDIPELTRHFIRTAASENALAIPEISGEAMEYLCRLPYPGNIRQLKNMVHRAVLVGGTRLTKDNFASQPGVEQKAPVTGLPSPNLDDMEKETIIKAMDDTGGNLTQVARILGITRQTLYRRLDKYGLK